MSNRYELDFEDVKLDGGTQVSYFIRDGHTGEELPGTRDTNGENVAIRSNRMNAEYSKIEHVAEELTRVLRFVAHDTKQQFVDAMSQQHRTLQQDFTKLCVKWIEHLSKLETSRYDLRNQASVELAKELVKTPAWQEHSYLPLI